MRFRVYKESGIGFRNHCGAKPPRHIEPAGLVTAVGWRDRASTSYAAADGVKAPASAARGRVRGSHGGRTAPSLSAETGTASRGGSLAGAVPPVLVRACRCSRTPPRPDGSHGSHGSITTTNEKEDTEKMSKGERYTPGPASGVQFRRFWSSHVDALERHLDRMTHMNQATPTQRKTERTRRGPNRESNKGETK